MRNLPYNRDRAVWGRYSKQGLRDVECFFGGTVLLWIEEKIEAQGSILENDIPVCVPSVLKELNERPFVVVLENNIRAKNKLLGWGYVEGLDFVIMGDKLTELCSKKNIKDKSHEVERVTIRQEQKSYLWKPIASLNDYHPLISVIVPCYNHAPYLRQRLDTIYGQTYNNIEVILLDDCSNDGSAEILKEYYGKYKNISNIYLNKNNSGSVFSQWEKGLSKAKGDLVWIAESDDYCEYDFLETMIVAFMDETVMLSFAPSSFVRDGKVTQTTERHLSDLKPYDWEASFYSTAQSLVANAWSIKNIIVNVSSCIFRKPVSISEEVKRLWSQFKLCGDWVFYLDIIKGGCVHYCHDTRNYYRRHNGSVAREMLSTMSYYDEHEKVACFIQKYYDVPRKAYERLLDILKLNYRCMIKNADDSVVEEYFRLNNILSNDIKKIPHIMMIGQYMGSGGGETFPIFLANELKRQGVPVTFVADLHSEKPSTRTMLRNDIPFLKNYKVDDLYHRAIQLGINIMHSHELNVDLRISRMLNNQDVIHHMITAHGMYEIPKFLLSDKNKKQIQKNCRAFVYLTDKNLGPFDKSGDNGQMKFYKIGNGLPYSKGKKISRKELGIKDDAFVFCIISRATREKGWGLAIEAVKILREEYNLNVELILVGDGLVYERLLNKVPEYVHLMGFRKNVRDFYMSADAGLLPSVFLAESYPLTLIDCLYCERPMIATDIGEVRNMLMTDNGEMAGATLRRNAKGEIDKEELVKMLKCVVEDKNFYSNMQSQCYEAACKFRIEKTGERYMSVYHEVMQN